MKNLARGRLQKRGMRRLLRCSFPKPFLGLWLMRPPLIRRRVQSAAELSYFNSLRAFRLLSVLAKET